MSDFSTNTMPLITVAMPIYNAGSYLRLAVFSILKQTYTHWELIIIDDGSTDHALKSIEDIQDARIHIRCDGQNKGLAARLNECIELARGEYIARMDQDDVSYPERFAKQIAYLQGHPDIDLVATRVITMDEDSQITGVFPYRLNHEQICAHPWRGFYFPHPAWMGKVVWFRKHCYAVPAPYFCEDQELLLRSHQESQFATLDQILFAYRIRHIVNWRKLFKTQRAVLKVQLRFFIKQQQYHLLLFSLFVFIGKVLNVIFNFALPKYFKSQQTIISSVAARNEWEQILREVRDTKR